ncbi:MAG: hypothetical protein QOI89_3154, partial [Solirubrobacteraceae bacterium]|nr:hypothetical protein [Solirubrobacteraceae bacterium]
AFEDVFRGLVKIVCFEVRLKLRQRGTCAMVMVSSEFQRV